MSVTNPEGLTWAEWARAAGLPVSFALWRRARRARRESTDTQTLYDARDSWRGGEDPTEWRAKR